MCQCRCLHLSSILTSAVRSESTFRLVLRSMVQFFYLTPKPVLLPDMPATRPYIEAVIGSNALCLLLHLLSPLPAGAGAGAGHLHGGLLLDFVGVRAPRSRASLVLLDLAVLGLQLVMHAANVKRGKWKTRAGVLAAAATAAVAGSGSAVDASAVLDDGAGGAALLESEAESRAEAALPAQAARQDLDWEERGIVRAAIDSNGASSLSSFSDGAVDGVVDADVTGPGHGHGHGHGHVDGAERERAAVDAALSELVSGDAVITRIRLLDTVRKQYLAYRHRERASTGSLAARLGPATASLRLWLNGRSAL